MPVKTFQQICKCENCGNEAEMQVTCTLDDGQKIVTPEPENGGKKADETLSKERIHGRSVCSHCGNEADMWLEVE